MIQRLPGTTIITFRNGIRLYEEFVRVYLRKNVVSDFLELIVELKL